MLLEGCELNLIYDVGKEDMVQALKDVSLTAGAGETVGIMGPSGSGKSSLLYVLSGLREPTSGTVYYKGIDMGSYTPDDRTKLRKREFGFIFQRLFLIEYLTVLENVVVGANDNSPATTNQALDLLDKLGLKSLASKKPSRLSGGQRQRVAIARALINGPSVIFADEPTASIDHRNGMEIMRILEDFKDRSAVIVVTHDRAILQNADKVIEIWDGLIKK